MGFGSARLCRRDHEATIRLEIRSRTECLEHAGDGRPRDNNQHGPDENLKLRNLWEGIDLLASIMTMQRPPKI